MLKLKKGDYVNIEGCTLEQVEKVRDAFVNAGFILDSRDDDESYADGRYKHVGIDKNDLVSLWDAVGRFGDNTKELTIDEVIAQPEPLISEEEEQAWNDMTKPDDKNDKYDKLVKSKVGPNYVTIDVYEVLKAWQVTNPALQHLIKKALQAGDRGHKTLAQDMDDIVASAIRAREISK